MVNCPEPFSINAKTPVTLALSIILTMAGSDFTLLGEHAKRKKPNTNKNTPYFGGAFTILKVIILFLITLLQILR